MQEKAQTNAGVDINERAKPLVSEGLVAHTQENSALDKKAGMGVEGLEPPTLSV